MSSERACQISAAKSARRAEQEKQNHAALSRRGQRHRERHGKANLIVRGQNEPQMRRAETKYCTRLQERVRVRVRVKYHSLKSLPFAEDSDLI